MTKIEKLTIGLMLVLMFLGVVPPLLSAANDLAVFTGVGIVLACGYFVVTKWEKVLNFFELMNSKEGK